MTRFVLTPHGIQELPEPSDFEKMLDGYGASLVKILYSMHETPSVIAPPFVWQFLDVHPEFPKLRAFLAFWDETIEANIREVVLSHSRLVRPTEVKRIGAEFRLH